MSGEERVHTYIYIYIYIIGAEGGLTGPPRTKAKVRTPSNVRGIVRTIIAFETWAKTKIHFVAARIE